MLCRVDSTHRGEKKEEKFFLFTLTSSLKLWHLISAQFHLEFLPTIMDIFWGDLSFLEEILLNTFKGREWRNI